MLMIPLRSVPPDSPARHGTILANRIRQLLFAAALFVYAILCLWPFSLNPPRHVQNAAMMSADGGGWVFQSPGLVRTEQPPEWIETAKRTHTLSIEIKLRSFSPTSQAQDLDRIVSIARTTYDRSLTIGQIGADLEVYMRSRGGPTLRISNVFVKPEWVSVTVSIDPREFRIETGNGRQVSQPLSPEPLRSWNASHLLSLGNEVTVARPWLGEIAELVVNVGGTRIDYFVDRPADLERPQAFWIVNREPKLRPFERVNLPDVAANLVMYIPFGCLIAMGFRRRSFVSGAVRAVSITAAVSFTLEVAQLFVATRNPSVTDLLLNVAGGLLGYILGLTISMKLVQYRRPGGGAAYKT